VFEPRIPHSYATSVGRRPNFSFEISTSPTDSLRWMWIPVPRSCASSLASRRRPIEASGSHSMPTLTSIRPFADPSLDRWPDRFTLAHELAHLLIHTRRSEICEHEANRFAGALLFPLDDFIEAMPPRPQLRDFVTLKSSWGVAASALVVRAHELDVIDDKRYRALQIQMAKWRKSEPMTFSPAYGQLLPRIIEVNGGNRLGREEPRTKPAASRRDSALATPTCRVGTGACAFLAAAVSRPQARASSFRRFKLSKGSRAK
jgi:hypothetical protein